LSRGYKCGQVLLTTFSLSVFFSLVLAGTLGATTERISSEGYELLPSATATSGGGDEGGGDQGGGDEGGDEGGGDQGGDEGGGDQNGDEEGGGDGSADFQPDSDTDEETEDTDDETEPEPTPQLDVTPEPSPSPQGLVAPTTPTPAPTPTPTPQGLAATQVECEEAVQQSSAASSLAASPATGFEVEGGDYASQCVPALQFGNTGNFQNAPPAVGPFPTVPEGTRLDPYAECIFNPNLLQCERDGPADPNLPPLPTPSTELCNGIDPNYPGCPGADILKFDRLTSDACDQLIGDPSRYFCKNPVVIQSATNTPTPPPTTTYKLCSPNPGVPDIPKCNPDILVSNCLDRPPFGTVCTELPDGTCPPGSFVGSATGGKSGVGTITCIENLPTTTPSPTTPTPPPSPTLSPSPSPTPTPTPTAITNINNNQVTVQNGRFTVQDTAGAVTSTPDCPPQSATVVLGPSPMQSGGARILAALDPCVLTDGGVVLNLPDEQGIQVVAANIQGGQTTQSVIVPMQRIAPITEGQTLYTVDLRGQITGPDPSTGAQATLNGNINALFLLNAGGQNVELSADNSAALNAVLS
jgi:hypothetical protein